MYSCRCPIADHRPRAQGGLQQCLTVPSKNLAHSNTATPFFFYKITAIAKNTIPPATTPIVEAFPLLAAAAICAASRASGALTPSTTMSR